MGNKFTSFAPFAIGILFFLCLSVSLSAQEVIDSVQYRAVYEFSYKTKSEQTDFAKRDLMYLDLGSKASKFYSRHHQIRDSIGNEGLRKGLPAFEISELRRGYPRGTTMVYYNFLKEQKRTITSNFSYLFTYYDEGRQIPKWQIENQTKAISGYNCQKASTRYLGRDWIVYFTTEIPIDQGPWKLWGLPGLIIEATDKDNFFKYTLKAFEKLEINRPIIFVNRTFSGKEYEKRNKKSFQEMEKLYYADHNEFMRLFLGVKLISATRADGTKIERITKPYIPLEP